MPNKELVLNNKLNTKQFGFQKFYVQEYKPNLTKAKIKQNKIDAVLITSTNLDEVRKMIDKAKNLNTTIIIQGSDDIFNRKVLEHKQVKILLSPETGHKERKLKQRDSGLNQVLCKIAKENNKIIAINLQEVIQRDPKQRRDLLEKIKQNIKLCKKTKTKLILTTLASTESEMRNIYDLKALALTLGMDTTTAKQSIEKRFL